MSVLRLLLLLLMFQGLPIMVTSCSTSGDQQQEDLIEDDQQDQQDQQDQEDEEDEEGEDDFGNENNNLADDGNQFSNNEGNQLANNEGNQFDNNEGQNNFANEELQNEGELQQIIEDMNNVNNNQFGQDDLANNQQIPLNDQLDAGMNNMVNGQAMEQVVEEETQAVPMEQATAASTGSPLAPGLPEIGSKMSYVVQKGDTLAKIASRVYGDPSKWSEIAEFTGIANPRLIYPGDVVYYQLTEQTLSFASSYESVTRSEVRVLEGDTLSSIASRVLGSSGGWKMIWRQNDNISNPDRLEVGSVIYYVEPGNMMALMGADSEKLTLNTEDYEANTTDTEDQTELDSQDFVDFGSSDLEFMI